MMQGTAFAGWGEKEGPRGGSPRSTMDDLFENSPAEYSMEYFFDELEAVAEEEGGRSGGTPSASQPGTQTLAEAVEAILSIERILHTMQYVELTDLRTLRKTLALAHVKLTTFAPQHLAAAKRAYEVAGRPVPALLDVLVGQLSRPLSACHPPPAPALPGCSALPIANLAATMDLLQREAQLEEGWAARPSSLHPAARPTVVEVPVDFSRYASMPIGVGRA